jgi:predicted metalloprotease with PDZ domain
MFWGLPYPHYTFILHLVPEGRGGLEHRDSTSLHADRFAFDGKEYEQFLIALVAHEFFHVWNGKRIRPERWARSTTRARTTPATSGSWRG